MTSPPTILFVCEHGAAKSVIAAAYLRHLAEARGSQVQAIARGTDPEPTLSTAAVAGLRAAGLPVPDDAPRRPSADELASASTVVSFGPRLEELVPEHVPCHYWDDVPAVSEDYQAASDAIVARVTDLLGRRA